MFIVNVLAQQFQKVKANVCNCFVICQRKKYHQGLCDQREMVLKMSFVLAGEENGGDRGGGREIEN